jgi:PAT family beta-lactamase induction signal transducer AmpG
LARISALSLRADSFTAFIVYLLYISVGEYKTSFYAISTGIMAIGMMVPGFISGFLQQAFGYSGVFIASVITAVPGLIMILFLPYKEEN